MSCIRWRFSARWPRACRRGRMLMSYAKLRFRQNATADAANRRTPPATSATPVGTHGAGAAWRRGSGGGGPAGCAETGHSRAPGAFHAAGRLAAPANPRNTCGHAKCCAAGSTAAAGRAGSQSAVPTYRAPRAASPSMPPRNTAWNGLDRSHGGLRRPAPISRQRRANRLCRLSPGRSRGTGRFPGRTGRVRRGCAKRP